MLNVSTIKSNSKLLKKVFSPFRARDHSSTDCTAWRGSASPLSSLKQNTNLTKEIFYSQQLTSLVRTGYQSQLMKSKYVKIQCNPYQNLNDIVCRYKKNSKMHLQSQGNMHLFQNSLEKEQSYRLHIFWFQNTVQNILDYCNSN